MACIGRSSKILLPYLILPLLLESFMASASHLRDESYRFLIYKLTGSFALTSFSIFLKAIERCCHGAGKRENNSLDFSKSVRILKDCDINK